MNDINGQHHNPAWGDQTVIEHAGRLSRQFRNGANKRPTPAKELENNSAYNDNKARDVGGHASNMPCRISAPGKGTARSH